MIHELQGEPVLKAFSFSAQTTLTVDASEYAVAGILSQDGHPVAYVSHTLSFSERNWSNIECEAYAVIWCVQRLRHYLLGRKFVLFSDHRPLEYLFNNGLDVSRRTSQRIARWALTLSQFDIEVRYKPGEEIPHADALSRLRNSSTDDLVFLNSVEEDGGDTDILSDDVDDIRSHFQSNSFYSKLMERIRHSRWNNVTALERQFHRSRKFLHVDNGLIYHRNRLFIPGPHRSKILARIHDTHMGVQQTLKKGAMTVWWPNFTKDVCSFVYSCLECQNSRFRGTPSTHTWPPSQPWQRLHID